MASGEDNDGCCADMDPDNFWGTPILILFFGFVITLAIALLEWLIGGIQPKYVFAAIAAVLTVVVAGISLLLNVIIRIFIGLSEFIREQHKKD